MFKVIKGLKERLEIKNRIRYILKRLGFFCFFILRNHVKSLMIKTLAVACKTQQRC